MLPTAGALRSSTAVRSACQLRHAAPGARAVFFAHTATTSSPAAQPLRGPGVHAAAQRRQQQQRRSSAGLQQRHAFASRVVIACAAEANTVELEVKVEGMKCGGCSSRVEAALKAMDHVKGVQVDLDTKLATVEVEAPNLIDAMNMLPQFVQAIKELGFEAEPHIEYQL